MKSKTGMVVSIAAAALAEYASFGATVVDDGIKDGVHGYTPKTRANVVGGQCCNWTKFTFTPRDLEWKMWSRALATAEILWTNPDPAKRNVAEFSARAAEHRRRLVSEHVNCAPLKGKAAG